MANAENDDIEVTVGDKPPEKVEKEPKVEVVKAETPDTKAIPANEGIEVLKRQLAEEKQGREADRAARRAAEERENAARQEAFRAKSDVQDTELQLVTNAVETVKGSMTALKSAYAQALQAQEWDKVADIQVALSTNAAKLLQLENGKEAMASRPKTEAPKGDAVEQFASQLTPRSAAWVRSHPQFVTDPRLNQKMIAAHTLVMADGVPVDTDDYFEAVEKTLGIAKQEIPEEDPSTQAAQVVQRRSSSPAAAPVTRSGGAPGQNPRVVRLTSEEREIARMNKMTDEEYARAKLDLRSEGRMN